MNLFERLTNEALRNRPELATLRPVVEKELLHQDILRELGAAGLLADLTFIGGTCLRVCYGSDRLSEDLDFTGGSDFSRESLTHLGSALVAGLQTKYGLEVEVKEPTRTMGRVSTWKLKIITRPGKKDQPSQKINIDVGAIPSYDRQPVMLRNRYGVDLGTSGLIIQAESRAEIFADKILALALRPNRLKYRDLWDMGWLKQQDVRLPLEMIRKKIIDHRSTVKEFTKLLAERANQIHRSPAVRDGFIHEMQRFLPKSSVAETISKPAYWDYLSTLIGEECRKVGSFLGQARGDVGEDYSRS